MSDQLQLEIITPYRTVLNMQVDSISLPGIEGELGILSDHIPLLTIVDTGVLTYTINKEIQSLAVHWGYAQVDANCVNVLAELVETEDEIDINRAKEAEKKAKKFLTSVNSKNSKLDDEKNELKKYESKLNRSIVRQRLTKNL